MSEGRLTPAQTALLARIESEGRVGVRGPQLAMARRLERRGLIELEVAGSGVPFQGDWWMEVVPSTRPVLRSSDNPDQE